MIEKMEDQRLDHDTQFTRTSPEPSAPTKARTSGQSSKRQRKSQMKMPLFLNLRKANGHTPDVSWETDGVSLGEYMMLNFGEYLKEESGYVYSLTLKGKPQERYYLSCGEKPNIEMPSRLSQILEQNPDPKYNLSEKACLGILRRAEKRGKVLPPMLDQALRRQAGLLVSKNEQESQGGGKGILIQNERTGALSTLNNQSVVYGISSDGSNAMRSSNPNSGIYEAETTRTLDNNGGSPACNQGGMAVVCLNDQGGQQMDVSEEVSGTLRAQEHGHQPIVLEGNGARPSHQGDGWHEGDPMYTLNSTEHHAVVIENHPADSRVKISEDGIVQTLSSRMETGGGNVPMVMESINGEISNTLDASYYKGCGERQGVEREVVCVGNGQLAQARLSPTVGTLNCMHDQQAVITMTTEMTPKTDDEGVAFSLRGRDYKDPQCVTYGLDRASFNQGMNAQYDFQIDEEKIGTQVAKGRGAVCQSVVRRLTPTECELLQGFPSGWTDIGDWVDSKGKKHKGEADSPRYKALGNSLALPFWNLLAGRICKQYNEQPTMGSLFSGIGGFELVFQNNGAKPVWSSEVEEFAIAVTKKRFQEGED